MTEIYSDILRLRLRHSYYGADPLPIDVVPADPAAFQRAGLMLRRQGEDWLVIAQERDLPVTPTLAIVVKSPNVLQVTRGAQWGAIPLISAPLGVDEITLSSNAASVPKSAKGGQLTLANLHVDLAATSRRLTVSFEANETHWAYNVLGLGSDAAFVEDPEGAVQFDAIAPRVLDDGRTAHVLRSRQALAGRARPTQRFALKIPGSFGPKTLIPVLPAPGPDIVPLTVPDPQGDLVQSDIFVTIL